MKISLIFASLILVVSSAIASCNSDYDCGYGNKCVKAQYNLRGTCMKSINQYGTQQYNTPKANFGVNMNRQCRFDMECPIGFKCTSGGNCIKR
jgi:hypothetical protein